MKLDEAFADQFLIEGISPVVFHATTYENFMNIIKNNRFKLSPAFTHAKEQEYGDSFYFLSTARSRTGSYGRTMDVIVRLDGRKLSQRYSGAAVDFFSQFGAPHQRFAGETELEDRVFSDKPYIDNALSYITGIDILISTGPKMRRDLFDIYRMFRRQNIPVRVYEKDSDFIQGNTRHLSHEEVKAFASSNRFPMEEPSREIDPNQKTIMSMLIKILKYGNENQLNSQEQETLVDMQSMSPSVTVNRFIRPVIENRQHMGFAQELTRLMGKRGLRTVDALANYIQTL